MRIGLIISAILIGTAAWFGMHHSRPSQSPLPAAVSLEDNQEPSSAAGTNTSTGGESAGNSSAQSPASSPASASTGTATTTASLPASGSAWLSTLPLGDGKYTTFGAKKGYIYVCNVAQGGGGAEGTPSWIHGSTWTPSEKVAVEGAVSWPNAVYSMKVSGSTRLITGNGLPTDHATGIFPIQSSDPAYQFDRNPNSIEAQNYSFSFPAYPSLSSSPNCIYGQVGIMNDGVALFDGFDAEYRDAVAHETQDFWEGHPDEAGVYHNHGFENNFLKDPVSEVVGFAFDGFPITGGKLADGTYLTSADLDECHGLSSAVNLDGKSVNTYHYVLTQDFPYSVSCFRGKSYEPKPGGGGGQSGMPKGQSGQGASGGSPSPTPPQAAISACSGKSSGSSCSFSTPNGNLSGICKIPPGQSSLACVPQ